ncbi:hypothetical protein KRZ98_04365 [Sphingobium sp. AS12]|uniref:hypothetical protein n=1 Tax=Sphingobium sp. AS12 TaxID=2849495 RepID=UPI001C31CFE2|nr:hypothetical protein [Sphingobium sp. AS12]MBV2147520.1 hypothetical protein [Sphingobium sp. AS12]
MAAHQLDREAPRGDVVLYDRQHLLIYAELLDADDAGLMWRDGATAILGVDPDVNPDFARCCWQSHLARARWIIGDGLQSATKAFGKMPRFKEAESRPE